MSKFNFSVLFIMILCFSLLAEIDYIYQGNLPKITLPEKAHNTVGEMPVIEHYDDGDLGGRSGYKQHRSYVTGESIAYSMVSCDSIYVGNY